jgi:2-furoyl-CoA dehydrogenase large subunit
MLGFSCKAIDDCGAVPALRAARLHHLGQVTPGCYRWQNVRVDFTQVCTNKSPVSAEPRLLAHAAPVADRADRRHRRAPSSASTRSTSASATTCARGCRGRRRTAAVYDSGDYGGCLDIALELIDSVDEERRRDAESPRQAARPRDRLDARLGHEQLRPVAAPEPDLQFSGNNEVATVKLDIFGEIVVTLGTVPQGQGTRRRRAGRRRHPRRLARRRHRAARPRHVLELARGLLGTYASQFAVTGLGAVKGAADKLAGEIKKVAGRCSAACRRMGSCSRAASRRSPRTRGRRSRSWASARS